MARGHEDWGIDTRQFVFSNIDIAELAVRLYSPTLWRRSGKVIFLDDFEDGLAPYILQIDDTDAAIVIDSTVSDTGTSCVKITPGLDGLFEANLEKHIPYLDIGKLGAEGTFWLPSGVTACVLRFDMITATVRQGGHLRVDPVNKELQYKSAAGVWTKIADIHDVYDTNPTFFNMKIVVDFESGEFVRAYLNELEYDLSGIGLRITTIGGDRKYLAIGANIYDTSGSQNVGYCGSLIATIDEP